MQANESRGVNAFFLVDTLGNLLAGCVVAASCHDGATTARVWDALALSSELLDRLQTVFVEGDLVAAFASAWPSVVYRCKYRQAYWLKKAAFLSTPNAGS